MQIYIYLGFFSNLKKHNYTHLNNKNSYVKIKYLS